MEHISKILPQTLEVQQKWELQQQESKRPRSGEENRFLEAREGKKIVESNLEEIKQALRYAMIKVGLRSQNFPSDEEKEILIMHIAQNFGNHTPNEVKLAFDMALSGKLNMEDVKCYENFSCLYFSQIMISYREWATQINSQIIREDHAHKIIQGAKEKVMTELDFLELYMAVKADILSDKINYNLIPDMIYDWMEKKGTIALTTERKIEYYDLAATKKMERYKEWVTENPTNNIINHAYASFKEEYEQKRFKEGTKKELRSLAKKLVIYDYIKEEDGTAN